MRASSPTSGGDPAEPEDAVAERRAGGPRARAGAARHGQPWTARGDPAAADGRRGPGGRGIRVRRASAARSPSRGVQYTSTGPWSSGTAAVFLNDSAGNDGGAAGQTTFARGGPGALAEALPRRCGRSGGDIRTGADVERVLVDGDRVRGVALRGGEEIHRADRRVGRRPEADAARPAGPGDARAEPGMARAQLPDAGRDGQGEPRPVGPAVVRGRRQRRPRAPVGPHPDRARHRLPGARIRRREVRPRVRGAVPGGDDPDAGRSVAGARGHARDERDPAVGAVHAARGRLGRPSATASPTWPSRPSSRTPPASPDWSSESETLSPVDLERDYGLTGGHALHGEATLDQFFAWRPLLGHARYRMPVRGLYLCGSGAHPGGGVTGGPGANAAREILADRKARAARTQAPTSAVVVSRRVRRSNRRLRQEVSGRCMGTRKRRTSCGQPQATAIFPAHSRAASSSATSTTAKPPRCSLVST